MTKPWGPDPAWDEEYDEIGPEDADFEEDRTFKEEQEQEKQQEEEKCKESTDTTRQHSTQN